MDEQKIETRPPAGGDDIEKGKGTAWLSYLHIFWLIPLLTLKDNAFAKFHVKQGIALDIITTGLWVVFFATLLTVVIPVISGIALVVTLVLRVIGLVQALSGKEWVCPLGIGALAGMFKF
jgi:uncharacterized membrane protein